MESMASSIRAPPILSTLPAEILASVVLKLDDPGDIVCLALASRHFLAVVTNAIKMSLKTFQRTAIVIQNVFASSLTTYREVFMKRLKHWSGLEGYVLCFDCRSMFIRVQKRSSLRLCRKCQDTPYWRAILNGNRGRARLHGACR